MKRIDANSRTIRELLDGAKFSIDSCQWESLQNYLVSDVSSADKLIGFAKTYLKS